MIYDGYIRIHIYYELCEWCSVLYTFMSCLSISSIHHSIDLIGFDVHWLLHNSWPFRNLWHLAQLWWDSSRRGGFFTRLWCRTVGFRHAKVSVWSSEVVGWDFWILSGIEESNANRSWNSLKDGKDMMRWFWALFLDGIFTRPRSLHESRLELGGKWEDFVGRLKLISKLANAYKCIRSLELIYAAVKHWTKSCS